MENAGEINRLVLQVNFVSQMVLQVNFVSQSKALVKVKSGGRELPIFELCFSLGTFSFSRATAFQMPSIEHSICEGWHLHVNKRMRSYGIRTARLLTVSRSIRRGVCLPGRGSAEGGVCQGGVADTAHP